MIRGLEHRGLLHDADDLAAAVVPTVRAALDAGDAVTLIVDRRTAREVRAALGPRADAVTFAPPTEVSRPGPEDVLRRLRSWASPARRTLVVGQYPGLDTADAGADRAVVEDGVDLVLADLPLTVLCACSRDAAPASVELLRRHHRHLDDGGDAVSPTHRVAADRSPVPAALWGPPLLRADFRELSDLRELRGRVAGAAAEAGLAGDPADAALLAVHEAAVLACRLRREDAPDCTVEIRAGAGAMLTDVVAAGSGPVDTGPLAVVRLFSRESSIDAVGPDHRIRVLSTG